MNIFYYKNILKDQMYQFSEIIMPIRWIFQQDNYPKHSSLASYFVFFKLFVFLVTQETKYLRYTREQKSCVQ